MSNGTGPIEQKWLVKSATIWGAIIGFVPTISAALGHPLAEETLADAQSLFDQALVIADKVNEFVGFALVVWGRWKAKTSLTVTPKRPV